MFTFTEEVIFSVLIDGTLFADSMWCQGQGKQ